MLILSSLLSESVNSVAWFFSLLELIFPCFFECLLILDQVLALQIITFFWILGFVVFLRHTSDELFLEHEVRLPGFDLSLSIFAFTLC